MNDAFLETLPASFAQQRLWFLDQLEPGSTLYNIPLALRLEGSLDVAVLRRCLTEIVRRHEVLRTTFSMTDGDLVQVIAPPESVLLPIDDLSAIRADEREAQAESRLIEEARQPFDLKRGPLLRSKLLRLDEDDHVLMLNVHHIVSDAWSSDVMANELRVLYDAFCRDEESPLPDLEIQYGDYAAWQRETLQGEKLQKLLAFWRQQLGDEVAGLDLPFDRPRGAIRSTRGGRESTHLDVNLMHELNAYSKREGATVFMTLLAAFKVFLSRYSGQKSVVVGSPIANRNRSEIENLIGFFTNTLTLRTDLSDSPSFVDVLKRVRETALDAYSHEELPFETLVEHLNPDRDLSRNPLFQVMFIYLDRQGDNYQLPGLRVTRWRLPTNTSKFDLTLSIHTSGDGARASFEYCSDLFDASTIRRMLANFQTLLHSIVSQPEQCIVELPLLAEKERRQLLVEWNGTSTEYQRQQCVHHLFEEQVERTPNATAVVFENSTLTYEELNNRASHLANCLRKLGVGPDVLVGICMHRSIDMLAAQLGVFKAGGAYVPLDPDYPRQRLAYMLRDAKIQIAVTQAELLECLDGSDTPLTCLDAMGQVIRGDNNPVAELQHAHVPNNLAYVIYTSGSTGNPKGVRIEHRSVVNFLCSMSQYPGLQSKDTLLAVTTLSFDISVLELLLPLIVGGKVVIVSRDVAVDGERLIETLDRTGATVMQATPATWQLLLDSGWEGQNGLKVLCGGEAMPPDLARRLLDCGDSVWNLYGPTETTVWSTVAQISDVESSIPIGRPIANTQVFLLSPARQLVPVGVPGELHIGGDGLGRDYLNRPELTTERFIGNPFDDDSNTRLYNTGDIARYRHDGALEILGRSDSQIKLRGFRIELGEIEAVLHEHPAIAQSVVVLREDRPGDKRLVSYCVSAGKSELDFVELKAHIRKRLPDYMIPSMFVALDKLPLTLNGKINRRDLPKPGDSRPELEIDYVAPRNPTEERLASIWRDVMTVNRIGIHDNFFDLGGHSLMATQIVSRIHQSFELNLPVRTMFESPTLASLARAIDQLDDQSNTLELPPIQRLQR